jgi:hypothetical protein
MKMIKNINHYFKRAKHNHCTKLYRDREEVKNLLLNIGIKQNQYSFTTQKIRTILKLYSTQNLLKTLAERFHATNKNLQKHLKELLAH